MNVTRSVLAVWLTLAGAVAQGAKGDPPQPAKTQRPEASEASGAIGAAARASLARAAELERATRGLRGPERSRALELAASAFDRLVAELDAEPAAAARAAWSAAELWRRHGSLALAEKDYLHAAAKDPARYGQRALLCAADMQRRQQRTEDARATYVRAAAVDPRTGHAHDARLWLARLLQTEQRLDDAIVAFQGALESAPTPAAGIETADLLAKAWIAKGDLDAAARAIEHAEDLVEAAGGGDPVDVERLRRAADGMGARRALERARDRQNGAGADAVRLDEQRRKDGE